MIIGLFIIAALFMLAMALLFPYMLFQLIFRRKKFGKDRINNALILLLVSGLISLPVEIYATHLLLLPNISINETDNTFIFKNHKYERCVKEYPGSSGLKLKLIAKGKTESGNIIYGFLENFIGNSYFIEKTDTQLEYIYERGLMWECSYKIVD